MKEKSGKKSGNLLGKDGSSFDAVVESPAMIGVAGQEKSRMASQTLLDPGYPVEMSQQVLRNGWVPANYVVEDRCRADTHRQAQLGKHGLEEPIIVPANHFSSMPAAAHGGQQHRSRRRPVWKDRRTPLDAQYVATRPLRGNVAETFQRHVYVGLTKCQGNNGYAIVGDAADFFSQLSIQVCENRCLLMRRACQDDGARSPVFLSRTADCPCCPAIFP